MTITLRPVRPDDDAFLFQVYAGTREEELAQVPWTQKQRAEFLGMQFRAQSQFYREQYPGATFDLILADDVPVGRLYLARWENEIRIMDIALLPEHRGKGIGTTLLQDILSEAASDGRTVSIHVERFNPALHLYQRLGFQEVADKGVYLLLRWAPDADQVNTAS